MKNYLKTVLALGFIATLSNAAYEAPQAQGNLTRWSSAETLAAGTLLGASEGIACSLADDMLPWPVSWWLFSEIKHLIAKAIINDAHRNGETLDSSLLLNSSRLASWITYLSLFKPVTVNRRTIFVDNPMVFVAYEWPQA